MPSPTAVQIALAPEEREMLEAWTRQRTTAAALSLRSRIVLACAGGESNTEIARRLGVHRNTVSLWRRRFLEFRLDGLLDEPRPGQPRKITDAQVDEVITKTLESAPKNATPWSTRSMAREAGLSQTAVSRIWRAFGLKPHLQDTWKLSKDPLFVEKVRDVRSGSNVQMMPNCDAQSVPAAPRRADSSPEAADMQVVSQWAVTGSNRRLPACKPVGLECREARRT
jgi:transposase